MKVLMLKITCKMYSDRHKYTGFSNTVTYDEALKTPSSMAHKMIDNNKSFEMEWLRVDKMMKLGR